MTMKKFLILFILIVFLTVSCVGPNKVGWTKPDLRQDQFENDRKECSDSIENLNSEAFGRALEECLGKKGYEFKKAEEPSSDKKVTAKDIGIVVLLIALSPLILVYGVFLIGRPG
jgi:hypothetical protein